MLRLIRTSPETMMIEAIARLAFLENRLPALERLLFANLRDPGKFPFVEVREDGGFLEQLEIHARLVLENGQNVRK